MHHRLGSSPTRLVGFEIFDSSFLHVYGRNVSRVEDKPAFSSRVDAFLLVCTGMLDRVSPPRRPLLPVVASKPRERANGLLPPFFLSQLICMWLARPSSMHQTFHSLRGCFIARRRKREAFDRPYFFLFFAFSQFLAYLTINFSFVFQVRIATACCTYRIYRRYRNRVSHCEKVT